MWGLSWLPLKALNKLGFESITLNLISFSLLSVLLLPFLIRQYSLWQRYKPTMLLIALLGGAANLSFIYALIVGDVVRVMVLFYLLPVWGVLGGRIFLHETIDRWRWLGVVLAIGGAFIVLGAFEALKQPPAWIDIIALAAGFFLAMLILVFRAVQAVPVVSKISAMFIGTVVMSALILLVTKQSVAGGETVGSWLALIAYAVFWSLIANLGSQWAVTQIEVGRSSIIIIMELVAAVVSASWIRGEMLTPYEIVGGIFIFSAALIEALRDRQTAAVNPT